MTYPDFKISDKIDLGERELRDFDMADHPDEGLILAYTTWDEPTIHL